MTESVNRLNGGQSGRKYVFVCGLPRSGTSLLGRNIARMENCTGFRNTGVLEDEGRFLQDVYPTEDVCGGPGRFGFDPRAHLTETSPLLIPENAAKLRESWHSHWDNSKTIFVEKTPANLLMTRFLQAVFPNSYFVVIIRHPIPVAMAAQKWKINVTSLYNMFEHWLYCHSLYEQDKKYLKHVYELSYEDYIRNANKHHLQIADFLRTRVPETPEHDTFRFVAQWRNPRGLRVPEHTIERPTAGHNQKYFNVWHDLLNDSHFRAYYQYIAVKYEPRFAKYGYSLLDGVKRQSVERARAISPAMGAVYCLISDVSAVTVRLITRSNGFVRRRVRACMPTRMKVKMKHLFQRPLLSRKHPETASF